MDPKRVVGVQGAVGLSTESGGVQGACGTDPWGVQGAVGLTPRHGQGAGVSLRFGGFEHTELSRGSQE